ncbi:hypothetical protein Q4602_05620 [Paraglaciecola chathamensis]|uniref:hypothetical protein n=1 Tax=Paraglaciecola chathamensis TaxID=368405 RepID=UPI0027047FB8|nr:hypothetical protein [Paraglaciecola chathamensis]MDO6838936.1 hypothetical protein [Paraglaciecola chathamensis]
MIKHKNITQTLIAERAEQLLNAHIKASRLMTNFLPTGKEELVADELQHLLERHHRYGIAGKLFEGDMLPEDFTMMEIFGLLEKLYAGYPFHAFDDSQIGVIETIQLAAKARHEIVIDDGISMRELYDLDDDFEPTSGEIELRELAAIADMSVQSIRNDISKNGAKLTLRSSEGKHYVSIKEAKEWLKQRNSFKPTINFIELDKIQQRDSTRYVPVAKDGSTFSHNCKMTRGYQIGEKGNERYIEVFSDALNELLIMPQAKWRRPNEKGNFGIVSAAEWKFVPENEVLNS